MVLRKNMDSEMLKRLDDPDDDMENYCNPDGEQREGESQRDWFRRLAGADERSPFVSLSWRDWRDMQRQAIYAFTEFQRAAERQDLLAVIGCGDDLMEVVREFQREAYFMAACCQRPAPARPQSCPRKE
jgi:hypothetical protein